MSKTTPSISRRRATISIDSRHLGISQLFSDLWENRELLYFLALRDIKVRYKQTSLGIAWVVLQPLLSTVIFSVVLGYFARLNTGRVPYILFALSGFTIWTFISSSIIYAGNSLVNNTQLITKVYFPRIIVPIAAVGAIFLDLLITFFVLFIFQAIYGVIPNWTLVFIPFFVLLSMLLALSVGILTAALNARFRDVKFIVPFALQVWLYISPIIYPLTLFPPKWQYLFYINPVTGILGGLQASLFGEPFNLISIGTSVIITFSLFIISIFTFRRMEEDFADYI